MKHPYLVHFLSIKTLDSINIKAQVSYKERITIGAAEISLKRPHSPLQSLGLLGSNYFQIKIIGKDENQKIVFKKVYESDGFGHFQFKIPTISPHRDIHTLVVYDIKTYLGIEILLGYFIPLLIRPDDKIVISDFDKTLVDTRYSSTKDVYRSLTSPLEHFPTVDKSLTILQEKIKNHHHPFILSASPHFYEDAIRDWLYQHQIYTAGIFLKDYRRIFSLFDDELLPKDIKKQGIYKLNHLLDILFMTGIPKELVLMGDNFETDSLIYLTLTAMIKDEYKDPWIFWNELKTQKSFPIGRKQNALILNKIYHLKNMLQAYKKTGHNSPKVSIYIRKKAEETSIAKLPVTLQSYEQYLRLYNGKKENQKNIKLGANNTI